MKSITPYKVGTKIDRAGTTDKALSLIMKDKALSTDQKFKAVSNWLWDNGKENMSMLGELFLFKGQHTKETRAFKSQVKFDFEMLVASMCQLYKDLASGLEKDIKKKDVRIALDNLAKRLASGAEMLDTANKNLTLQREASRGYGIYVDKNGKVYSILDEKAEGAIKKHIHE